MTYLSVDEQDAAIRRLFPDFRLKASADWIGVWEGPVRPASKTYTIRIVYFRRGFFDGWHLSNHYVTVHVVDPLIGALMLSGDDLPHIYWNDRAPLWPALCLWDPDEMCWTPEMTIATTIIPGGGMVAVFRILADIGRISRTRPSSAQEAQRMPEPGRDFRPGDPRSKGAIPQRRIPQDWPKDRRFRILSLDGGGIKGLFPATVLGELERRYLSGNSIAGYFDLVAGTSTGGILALGLGAGLTAAEMADLYLTRGPEVFPQPSDTPWDAPARG